MKLPGVTVMLSATALILAAGQVSAQDTQGNGPGSPSHKQSSNAPGNTSSSQQKSGSVKSAVKHAKTECKSDAQKFCKDVTPGKGRVASCLLSNEDKLSQQCNSALDTASQTISQKIDKTEVQFRKDCGQDVQKYCADVPSGGGRLIDCLESHQDNLSSSCKGFQTKVEKKLEKEFG